MSFVWSLFQIYELMPCLQRGPSQLLYLAGDPPNIIIGSSFEEVGFVDFIVHVLPGIFLFCVPASLAVVIWIYRYYLTAKEMKALNGDKLKAAYPIYDEPRLLIAGTVTFFVILMFFLHPVHHKETAWVALIGAFVVSIFLCCVQLGRQTKSSSAHYSWTSTI